MDIAGSVKKLTSNKLALAVIIVIILITIYFVYKSRESFGSGKKKRAKPKAKKRAVVRERMRKKPDSAESSEEEELSPKELYKAVHKNMLDGMSADEFSAAAGTNNKALYIELRQLYNNAKSGSDITASDYSKILDKLEID